jgi:hypothetical protein
LSNTKEYAQQPLIGGSLDPIEFDKPFYVDNVGYTIGLGEKVSKDGESPDYVLRREPHLRQIILPNSCVWFEAGHIAANENRLFPKGMGYDGDQRFIGGITFIYEKVKEYERMTR